MPTSDFQDTWGFPNEVQKTIKEAHHYVVVATDRTYRSGRKITEVVFLTGDDREIERRSGMSLMSKRNNRPYVVCRRVPDPLPPPLDLTRQTRANGYESKFNTDDIFDDDA